jgi:hypothetical protein
MIFKMQVKFARNYRKQKKLQKADLLRHLEIDEKCSTENGHKHLCLWTDGRVCPVKETGATRLALE